MMKHKHKWIMNQGEAECCFIKKNKSKCDAKLDPQEIERRLNATEVLSAGDVRYTAKFGIHPKVMANLEKYANVLEEKL